MSVSDSDNANELEIVKQQLRDITHRLWRVESELLDIKSLQKMGEKSSIITTRSSSIMTNDIPVETCNDISYNEEEDMISYDDNNREVNTLNITSNSTIYESDEENYENSDDQDNLTTTQRMLRLLSSPSITKEESIALPIHNTNTLHMFAIGALAEAVEETELNGIHARRKRWRSRLFSFLSVVVMSVTLTVLFFVTYESTSPTCSTHTDCQIGSFCNRDLMDVVYKKQRCSQCDLILSEEEGGEELQCDKFILNNPIWHQQIDHTVLWYDGNGNANYNQSLFSFSDDESIFLRCLSLKHCKGSALVGDQLDSNGYLRLHLSKLSTDQIGVLFFIAILYGSIISGELTEAAIEEATLNAISEPCSKSMPLCFRVIQFSLRLRQLVLPWFIGTATIGVILTESFEPKNILLNFLAVSFLIEADKMLAHLLLTSHQQSLVDRVVLSNIRYGTEFISVSSVWSLILGTVISISVVMIVCGIEQFMSFELCYDCTIENILTNFIMSGVCGSSLCWALGHMKRMDWDTFVLFLLEFCRSHITAIFGILWGVATSLLFIYKRNFWLDTFMFISLIGAGGSLILIVAETILMQYRERRRFGNLYCKTIMIIFFIAFYFIFLSWIVVSVVARKRIELELFLKMWTV